MIEASNKQTITLIRGWSGSGKTTLAKKLIKERVNTIHLEADQFFINPQGEYQYNKELIKFAHQWCQSETVRNVHFGRSVIVSNTFCALWEMKFYIELSISKNIDLEIIECKGTFRNVHGVADDVINIQKQRFERLN